MRVNPFRLKFVLLVGVALVFGSGASGAQDVSAVRADMLRYDYAAAATEADQILASGKDSEKPEAAVLKLRALSRARNHAGVRLNLGACIGAARGTPQELECEYEQIYSLYKNAHQVDTAYREFGELLAKNPESVYAASGAAYQRAVIELERYHKVDSTSESLELLLKNYPETPFRAKALFVLLRCAIKSNNREAVIGAHRRFESQCPDSQYLPDAELLHGDFELKACGDSKSALNRYRSIVQKWPTTDFAKLARLRIDEMAPDGFEAAIADYEDLLKTIRVHPKFKYARNDARSQIGIYQYQLGKEQAAKSTFGYLLASKPGVHLEGVSRMYLTGIDDYESTYGICCLCERAGRWFDQGDRQKALDDLKLVDSLTRSEKLKRLLDDATLPPEERGETLYRLAVAKYWVGKKSEATLLARKILDEVRPTGYSKGQALYLLATDEANHADVDSSTKHYKEFLAGDYPQLPRLTVQAYLDYSRSQANVAKRPLEALLSLEQFAIRFPNRVETREALEFQEEVLSRHPELAKSFDSGKAKLHKAALAIRGSAQPTADLDNDLNAIQQTEKE